MSSYQKVIIVGNLGRDPEAKVLPDGTPVTSFSVAVSNKHKDASGTIVDEVTWFRVSAWRRQAEIAAQYLSKGSSVLIEGKLAPDKQTGRPVIWTGQDGTPRANYDLTADRIVLLGSRGDSSSPSESAPEPPAGAEDIPF